MSANLKEMRDKHIFTDVVLLLDDGTQLQAHKYYLAIGSIYFRRIFLSDESVKLVRLVGMDDDTTQQIIALIYGEKMTLTLETVEKVWIAANQMELTYACPECLRFIADNLDDRNALSVYKNTKSVELKDIALRYILRNFVAILECGGDFSQLDSLELLAIVESDHLKVAAEHIVWELVLQWIEFSPDERATNVASLLAATRIGLLKEEYFNEMVATNSYVEANDECKVIIATARKYMKECKDMLDKRKLVRRDKPIFTPLFATPRIPQHLVFAIGGWSNRVMSKAVEVYDTHADKWIHMAHIGAKEALTNYGIGVVGSVFYMIGGYTGNGVLNYGTTFDVVTKEWGKTPYMRFKRCFLGVVVLGGDIYAIGGYDGLEILRSVEKYIVQSKRWITVAPMCYPRCDFGAAALRDKIYVVGGFSGDNTLPSVEVYDSTSNKWSIITLMSMPRNGLACVAKDDFIYVIGGYNGFARLKNCERYDIEKDKWTRICSMQYGRSHLSAVVVHGVIMAIGGSNGTTAVSHSECYDSFTNQWYPSDNLMINRSALSACVVENVPNAEDYCYPLRNQRAEEKRLRLKGTYLMKYRNEDELSNSEEEEDVEKEIEGKGDEEDEEEDEKIQEVNEEEEDKEESDVEEGADEVERVVRGQDVEEEDEDFENLVSKTALIPPIQEINQHFSSVYAHTEYQYSNDSEESDLVSTSQSLTMEEFDDHFDEWSSLEEDDDSGPDSYS